MTLWGPWVCKRIPRNLRANCNTAVQRGKGGKGGKAATKFFSKKQEDDREWHKQRAGVERLCMKFAGGFSLSHRMGEGQGEGNSQPSTLNSPLF